MYFNQFYVWNIISACTKEGNVLWKGRGCSSVFLILQKSDWHLPLGFYYVTLGVSVMIKLRHEISKIVCLQWDQTIFNGSCKVPNNFDVNKNYSWMIFYDSIRMFLWTWRFWPHKLPVAYNLHYNFHNDLVVFVSKSKLWLNGDM